MTTYIVLISLTDAGIKAAKDSPRRLDAAKKLLTDMGALRTGRDTLASSGSHCSAASIEQARLRAHEDVEGVPRNRLPRNHSLARLSLPCREPMQQPDATPGSHP
jgi:hypothetical protein